MTQQTVSPEIKEIFQDPDFESLLKTLATEFGEDITLKSVNFLFQQNRPVPEKLINGVNYSAGYRGQYMVAEGKHTGKLIDIKQSGSNCKLMFDLDDKQVFLYHNFPKDGLKVEQVVSLAESRGKAFDVVVKHETIPQTGDKHAVIEFVTGLSDVLKA